MDDLATDQSLTVFDRIDLPWKEKLAYLAYQISLLPQVPSEPTHHFRNKIYMREIHLPRDTVLIGRPHRLGHQCDLVEGSVLLVTEEGRFRIEAPFTMVTKPGFQMVIHALTDIVGRTFHPNETDSRDIALLESAAFEPAEPVIELGKRLSERLPQQLGGV